MTVDLNDLLAGFGFAPVLDDEWWRKSNGLLISLEDAGDGEWLMAMASEGKTPRLEFAGSLGQCLFQVVATLLAHSAASLADARTIRPAPPAQLPL